MSRRQTRGNIASLAKFLFSGMERLDHLEFGRPYPAPLVYPHIARYLFAARFCEGKACLDVACGCGYGSQLLLLSGADRVVGGDIQHSLLQRAAQHLSHPNLTFVCLDANLMPFSDLSFDFVVSFETIEHLARPDEFLKEVSRVMKSDGVFVCSTPNGAVSPPHPSNPHNRFHLKEYSLSEFVSMLSRHFGHVLIFGQGPISGNDIRLSRAANLLKWVGARYQFFDKLLSVASATLRGDLRFVRLEEAICREFNGPLGYNPYNLDKGSNYEPMSLVAFVRKNPLTC